MKTCYGKKHFCINVISIFVCGLQIVEPAAATTAKIIDTGSCTDYNNDTNITLKTAWKTYQYNKNHVVVKFSFYQNGKLMKTSSSITITKVNSKKLKIVSITQGKEINDDGYYSYFYSKNTDYLKYTSTARKFYFNEIKPGLIAHLFDLINLFLFLFSFIKKVSLMYNSSILKKLLIKTRIP